MVGQDVVIGNPFRSDGKDKSSDGLGSWVLQSTNSPDNELGKEPGIGVQVESKASCRRSTCELGNHV